MSRTRRIAWLPAIWLLALAGGLLAGEGIYRWAAEDFPRVKQIAFMLANVDSIEHAERLAAESEQLRPSWRWPWSDEVHCVVERGPYLWAGAAAGAVAGGLGLLLIWAAGRRRGGREGVAARNRLD